MNQSKLRRQIAWEAARLLYEHRETHCHRAKIQAARKLTKSWVKPQDMPTDAEVHEQLHSMNGRPETALPARAEDDWAGVEDDPARFALYEALLLPLENVKQNPRVHPEGDALYHSLQVFQLTQDAYPYDEETLLAALLHDVGKAIDPQDHVNAGLAVLDGYVTDRTYWMIENMPQAQLLFEGTLGVRAKRRLENNESFEELQALSEFDRQGRRQGAVTPDVSEALDYVKDLEGAFED